MKNFIAKVVNKLGYVLASLIILVALLVSVSRLVTPILNQHRTDFEALASQLLQTPVMIQQVEVSWHGYTPEFSLKNVTILDKDTQKPKLTLQRFDIGFSLWRSLLAWQVFVQNITVSGVELTISQQVSGNIKVGSLTAFNMKDSLTGTSVETDKLVEWVFSQPRLALMNIDVTYNLPNQPPLFIQLKHLSLRNDSDHHMVDGEAILKQETPTKADVHLAWDGDVRKLVEARGHFYVYLEGLSLSQWFSNFSWQGLQVKKGLASIKIWAEWRNKQWDLLQSTFQAFGIELYSPEQKKSEVIDRLSANIGCKRDGNNQLFGGDQIYIDLPNHLWPVTDFHVQVTTDAKGIMLQDMRSSYLNLADINHFLQLTHSLLTPAMREMLQTLDPKGEITNLQATLPMTPDDISSVSVAAEFKGLTMSAWQPYPAIANLAGHVNWDGKAGQLQLDSAHAFIEINKLFEQPFYINKLQAALDFQKLATGEWSLHAKDILIQDDNANATTNLSLTIPATGSPTIDLTADFQMMKAENISHYLPLKVFDPDLVKWLQNAFKAGTTHDGKIVVQGLLSDFPWDNKNGKFLIASQVSNADLYFAPGWPMITHINGMLTFMGHAMTIDVQSGNILNVPLGKVQADIPYIGDDHPQILNVNGAVHADLADGLHFIRQSPLQKTIGRDLSALELKGPMQLALSLSVPLKHPDLTKVNGNVSMQNSTLSLPDWTLIYSNVNGGFDFTDDGIEAKNLQGQLLGNPAALTIKTLRQNGIAQQIRADLLSTTNINAVQNWLGLSLSTVAQGATSYQAQLFLSSAEKSQTDHVVIRSDLKGISVNAPAPYGKAADAATNFQFDVNLGDSQGIKAKLDYAKLISAALNLQKAKHGLQLMGGEIRLGGQSANWQSGAGVTIRGQMMVLDLDQWQRYFTSLQGKSTSHADIKMLRGVDLSANTFNVLGQELHRVRLQATNNVNAWIIRLESNEIAGDITLPMNFAQRAVEARLQHLYLGSPTLKQTAQSIDPKTLPNFIIDAYDVRLAGGSIGHVQLNTVSSSSGLRIQQLHIDESNLKLDATGDWVASSGRSTTHLEGNASSPYFSDVLKQWGFSSTNFVGSTGNITFNLNWPDAPYRMSLKGLNGDFSIKLGEGRIVEVSESSNAEMGFGRMLNIFSLSSIPRRLSLDFSDIVQKGYSFDTMKGDFTLKNGSAITNNMRFDGPVARVDIKGRVGLFAKDFDLMLGVTPYVTSSLPVVAAIAGGPVAGVATWVVDKVISSGVSRLTTYQYQVTGPWSNPTWSKVNAAGQKISRIFYPSLIQSVNNGPKHYPLPLQSAS